jgi:phenylpropionate dioxygenase-like ring-hydroxylating dioxygenase large terminal subunit
MIPSENYEKVEALNLEFANIFKSVWIFFGFKSEFLESPIIDREIMGMPIIGALIENQLTAYLNVCPHRGMKLVKDKTFLGNKKIIICPYHNWAFKIETGESINVDSDTLCNGNDSCTSLRNVQIDSVGEFVFINLSKENKISLIDYLVPVSENLIEATNSLDFERITTKNILHNCNWKHIVENVIDNKHCAPVHKMTLAQLGFCKNKPETTLFDIHSLFKIYPESETLSTKRINLLKKVYKNSDLVDYYEHILIFPNLTISIFEGLHYTIGFINPIDEQTTVYMTHYLRPKIVDENISNSIENSHVASAIDIFSEDVQMLNELKNNLSLSDFSGEVYKDELRIIHFMDVYNRFLNKK